MSVSLIDSHCHLDLEPLIAELPLIIQEAAAAGVDGFVVPAVHPDGWPGISAVAAENALVMPAYGVHPMHADTVCDQLLERLTERAGQAAAIGEIGLDPAYVVPLTVQEQAFREQLRVAVTCGLPVLIHCRRAFQSVLQIMREERAGQVGGIMHAFSGSVEMAREFIRLGFAISISGSVTWSNAAKPLRIARELPLAHLVLETDAPDMIPECHRGHFNRPAWLLETARRVAEVREIALEDVAQTTSDNVRRLLHRHSKSA